MKKKQLICSALAAAMLLGSTVTSAGAARFPDSTGHWGESAIDRWSNYGVVVGANGYFNPDASITRGEMASIIAGMLGLEDAAPNRYPDLNGGWYSDAMLKCVAAGIMTGDDHGRMRPYDNITGAEIAVMLTKALDLDNTGYSYAYPSVSTGYVKPWAQGYVNALASRGVSIGNDGGVFQPMQNTSRAAVVSMFDRAVGTYVTSPGTYTASGLTIINTTGTVTLRGSASGVIVTDASDRVRLTLDDTRVTGAVDLRADEVQLTAEGAEITGDLTVNGAKSRISLTGGTDAKAIIIGGDADDTAVSMARGTTADTITTGAQETDLSIAGKVDSIELRPGASSSVVDVRSGGTVAALDCGANKVNIKGDGTLKRATVSGDNNRIDTASTTVKVQSGASGTRVNGVLKSSGSSTSGSSGSSSSSSSSSSSLRYTVTYRLASDVDNSSYVAYATDRFYRGDYVDYLNISDSKAPKSGYEFDDWYTSRSGSTRFDFDGIKIRDNYTLYGRWKKKAQTPAQPETPAESAGVTAARNALATALNAVDDSDEQKKIVAVNAKTTGATVTFKSGDLALAVAQQTAENEADTETGTAAASAAATMNALAEAINSVAGWKATVGDQDVSGAALNSENVEKTQGLANKSVTVTMTKTAESKADGAANGGTAGSTATTATAEKFTYQITYKVEEPEIPAETAKNAANATELNAALAVETVTEITVTGRIELENLTKQGDRNITIKFGENGELVLTGADSAEIDGFTFESPDKVLLTKPVFAAFKNTLSGFTKTDTIEVVNGSTIKITKPAEGSEVTAGAAAKPITDAIVKAKEVMASASWKCNDSEAEAKNALTTAITAILNATAGTNTVKITIAAAGVTQDFNISFEITNAADMSSDAPPAGN